MAIADITMQLLGACKEALIALKGQVDYECPWCDGEGEGPKPSNQFIVGHGEDCPITIVESAIAKATAG